MTVLLPRGAWENAPKGTEFNSKLSGQHRHFTAEDI